MCQADAKGRMAGDVHSWGQTTDREVEFCLLHFLDKSFDFHPVFAVLFGNLI